MCRAWHFLQWFVSACVEASPGGVSLASDSAHRAITVLNQTPFSRLAGQVMPNAFRIASWIIESG
jgi:hypothetical protein